jgi:hypothetical protein
MERTVIRARKKRPLEPQICDFPLPIQCRAVPLAFLIDANGTVPLGWGVKYEAEYLVSGMRSPISILLIAMATLVACKKSSSPGVPGAYVAKYAHGTDRLRLCADGTFEQWFTSTSGTTSTNVGTWSGPSTNGQVLMSNFTMFDDGFGQPHPKPEPALVSLRYEARGDRTSLGFNKGLEDIYRKQ